MSNHTNWLRRSVILGVMATVIGIGLLVASCAQQAATPAGGTLQGAARRVSSEDLEIVTGQRLYVPAYSKIYTNDENSTFDLTVTLSVRNTDAESPIVISSIRYYDTAGSLVREYIQSPLELAPMATTEVVVSRLDSHGGSGANFIVEWGAEELVHEPIVEALMTGTSGQQGLSFLTTARVLEEKP